MMNNKKSINILGIMLMVFSCTPASAQEKIYTLVTQSHKADIKYKAFKNFSSLKIYKNDGLKKAFVPKKGKRDVYVFLSEFEGDSFDGTRKLFHDYLILKVDPASQLIIDGFHYTMEWAEPPASSDLYRLTDSSMKIHDNFQLDELQMELVESDEIEGKKFLEDHGILKLK